MKIALLVSLLFITSLYSQVENKDILLIHAAQRDSQNNTFPATGNESWYLPTTQLSKSDIFVEYIAEYLQGLLALTENYTDVNVEFNSVGAANSLADIYYDPQFASIKSSIINGGYKYVIFFDSEQANAYPEIMYEACKQFSKPILETGGTPLLMMNYSSYISTEKLGEFNYRAANGNGIAVIPAGYAIKEAGLEGRRTGAENARQAMISASAIYKKITGLNAANANYTPTYEHTNIAAANQYTLSSSEITTLANYATAAVTTHDTTEHYNTSYENDGAVVYRSLDISSTPFNNVVNYFFKGTSTQDFTRDKLDILINNSLTSASLKIGTQNYDTRDWTTSDTENRTSTFEEKAGLGIFLYAGGSDPGANAQDIINISQQNLVPLVFDWIKGFESTSGTTSTTNALNNDGCADLWYNYHFRGWKTIPLSIGMGRLNETFSNFAASDDALHISDPLVYMNASMMIASAMGTKLPVPDDLPIRAGNWSQEQLKTTMEIGHDIIKELAYMSETYTYIPDSNLSISTKSIPEITANQPFSFQLEASGGVANYQWEIAPYSSLPNGLSLSNDGIISGTSSTNFTAQYLVVKVTDTNGAIRKASLRLIPGLPAAVNMTVNANPEKATIITLPLYESDPNLITYTYTNPTEGTLSGTAPNLIYTPLAGATSDSFTYTLAYPGKEPSQATVNISIATVVAVDLNLTLNPGRASALSLPISDSAFISYSFTSPSLGTLSGVAPSLIYTSNTGTTMDSFTYTITYPGKVPTNATVHISIANAPVSNAHYPLNDETGTKVTDISGKGFDGIAFNGTWTTGQNEGAMEFNGSTTSVYIPPTVFETVTNEISIVMWVFGGETLPKNNSIISAVDASGTKLLNIHLPYGNSTVFWDAGNSTKFDRINKVANTDEFKGQWNHWVFTKNVTDGSMKMYLNGALWQSGTGFTTPIGKVSTATLGSRTDGKLFYEGLIDDVRIYNIELTVDEVARIYNETKNLATSSFNLLDKKVSIYPNPVTNGELSVSFSSQSNENISIELYTMDGRRLFQKNYNNNEEVIKLNMNGISSGVYFLKTTRGNLNNVQKVLVK